MPVREEVIKGTVAGNLAKQKGEQNQAGVGCKTRDRSPKQRSPWRSRGERGIVTTISTKMLFWKIQQKIEFDQNSNRSSKLRTQKCV